MKENQIKVQIDEVSLSSAPHCRHGPTVLFEEEFKGKGKKFYGCSSCRDRKHCSFYWLVEEGGRTLNTKQPPLPKVKKETVHEDFRDQMNILKSLTPQDRRFCRTCAKAVFKENTHKNHNVVQGVTDEELKNPLSLVDSIDTNETNAQYFFSESSTDLIKQVILSLDIKAVLCIGTPSLHMRFQKVGKLKSYLLDIDERLVNISNYMHPSSSSHYNFFNHHFFSLKSKKDYLTFAQALDPQQVVIVADPPFGALLHLLMHSVHLLSKQFFGAEYKGCFLKTFLVYPYFLEAKICKRWHDFNAGKSDIGDANTFRMLDCQIEYHNHKRLRKRLHSGISSGGGNSAGCSSGGGSSSSSATSSVVRLFTNVPLRHVRLPEKLGYRFCELCEMYVSTHNKHCVKCNSCTTKVGDTYKHCDICQLCVKATWKHCPKRGVCCLPEEHFKGKKKKKKQ